MVVNVFNVHLVIIFAHVLIHTVAFVVKVNVLLVTVYDQTRNQIHYFDFLGNTAAVTPVATTSSATCSSSLCSNRGTCQQNGYGIQCYCLTGWSGSRCQYSKLKVFKRFSKI
jgi:preprotein translocase subunit SecY